MSKKTVRVRLPRKKPSDFFELLKKIVEQHNEMGASSPLNNFSNLDMTKFGQNLQQAEQLYEEAVYHRNMAQSKMHQAKELMGFAVGQTASTEGTLYYDTVLITGILKSAYMGAEETMSLFGYNVVIGSAKLPKRRKQQP